jgi:hypothetical protein
MRIKNFIASLLLFIILLHAVAASSIAADWKFVTRCPNYKLFVDMESILVKASDVRVWQKLVYSRPQHRQLYSPPSMTFNLEKDLYLYHCDKRTYHILEITTYARQEGSSTVVSSLSFPEISSLENKLLPGSIPADVYEFACRDKRMPKRR